MTRQSRESYDTTYATDLSMAAGIHSSFFVIALTILLGSSHADPNGVSTRLTQSIMLAIVGLVAIARSGLRISLYKHITALNTNKEKCAAVASQLGIGVSHLGYGAVGCIAVQREFLNSEVRDDTTTMLRLILLCSVSLHCISSIAEACMSDNILKQVMRLPLENRPFRSKKFFQSSKILECVTLAFFAVHFSVYGKSLINDTNVAFNSTQTTAAVSSYSISDAVGIAVGAVLLFNQSVLIGFSLLPQLWFNAISECARQCCRQSSKPPQQINPNKIEIQPTYEP